MSKIKIPVFNQKFDLRTFLIIFKRSFWIIVLIFILAIIIGIVKYRYTLPVFETKVILQIKQENQTNRILNIDYGLTQTDLSYALELIQSKTFLNNCLKKLPLEVEYYKKGTFLSSEIYKQSPFAVELNVSNSAIYNQNIYIYFINNKYLLRYKIGSNEYEFILTPDEWHPIYGGEIIVTYNSPDRIKSEEANNNRSNYFFVLKNPESVYKTVSSNLNVRVHKESARTIMLTYSDNNPNKAADILNNIAESYLTYELEQKSQSANNVINYIDQQLDVIYKQLEDNEKEMHDFRKENKIPPGIKEFGYGKFSFLTTKISDIEDNIIKLELEILTLKQVKQQIYEEPDFNVYEVMSLLYGTSSQGFMNSMIGSLQSLMDKKELLLFDVTQNNLKIQMIDEQIDRKKELIASFIDSSIERLDQKITDYSSMITEFESQMFVDSAYKEIEFAKLNRIYSINENFYYELIRTKAEYMISQAGFVSDNLILEKASAPKMQKKPILSQILLIAIIIAILLSTGIITIRYLLYNKIRSIDDITAFSDITILGGVPKSKIKSEVSQLILHNRPKSMLAEAFRNIRSNLEFINSESKSKIITISSTISGEGKTFVALNLGAILAMAGHKVILLDFDLRKPRFHKSFQVENLKGISTILIGRHNIEECLKNTEIENLSFISSGPIPPNPSEILMGKGYKNLLSELKQNYDYIIIDTPPIGIVTDAMISYQIADYPIYVTRSEISPKVFIEHINEFAETSKLKNLSIVLNGVESSNSAYGYGYKYGYGYRYSYAKYGYGYTENMNKNYYTLDSDDKKSIIKRIIDIFKKNID
ncbi:MAG: polysaccharide biosynthesis tyrosine autokinase [Bacteroidales bacterium]|nr:polysaccharide biosynthesis tyrosine autokinase [Bacteroidales bacterium]